MMKTKEIKMTEFERKCYGMSQDDIRINIINSITTKMVGIEMTIMGILSDAQTMLEFDDSDQARKYMNIAKFILAEQLQEKQKVDAKHEQNYFSRLQQKVA
jgi:hypothetical protein